MKSGRFARRLSDGEGFPASLNAATAPGVCAGSQKDRAKMRFAFDQPLYGSE